MTNSIHTGKSCGNQQTKTCNCHNDIKTTNTEQYSNEGSSISDRKTPSNIAKTTAHVFDSNQLHTHHNVDKPYSFIKHFERILKLDVSRDSHNLQESIRLLLLVTLSALLMGIGSWFFLTCLSYCTAIHSANHFLIWFLPIACVGTVFVYHRYGKTSSGGNNLVIKSATKGEHIPLRMAPLVLFATLATHLTGGSAGREGTAVQMGGTIASGLGDYFHLGKHDRHILVLSGISAAFGSVFGAPLAGTFFGLEMCFIGHLDYQSIIYCFYSSFFANFVTHSLGIEHSVNSISSIPTASFKNILIVLFCAICFGLMARLFAWSLRKAKSFYKTQNYLIGAFIGALVVTLIIVVFNLHQFSGLSSWIIDAGFEGKTSLADPFLKLGLTVLTLGAGCQGGEVTPLFGIGSSLGGALALLFGLDPSFLAAIGMVCVFGSATNVPLTTIMLSLDMFGGTGAAWFVGCAFIAYLVAGHRSIYAAQTIVTPKRRSLKNDELLTVAQAIEQHDHQDEQLTSN